MKVHDVVGDQDWLTITDLDNFFTVHIDPRGNYMYNLNESVYVNVPSEQLQTFTCSARMHWPLISYKIYGTTRLAWLLMKINNVKPIDMFNAKNPSDVIYYIDKDVLQEIVRTINGYEDY